MRIGIRSCQKEVCLLRAVNKRTEMISAPKQARRLRLLVILLIHVVHHRRSLRCFVNDPDDASGFRRI